MVCLRVWCLAGFPGGAGLVGLLGIGGLGVCLTFTLVDVNLGWSVWGIVVYGGVCGAPFSFEACVGLI